MKDRDQKAKALRYCVAKRWFPQIEVDVRPVRHVRDKVALVTDLDVLAFIPDQFRGYRAIVFDCKTRSKESAVNRSMWLRGTLDLMQAEIGVCIMKKSVIDADHKLVATELDIVLLAEDEFEIYVEATCPQFKGPFGATGEMSVWDSLLEIQSKYPRLESTFRFLRSEYWMQKEAAISCRQVIAKLNLIHGELNPDKEEHQYIVCDMAALFAHSLARICCYLFKAYLHPKRQVDLDEAVKILIYGGRDAYDHRNNLYRRLQQKEGPRGIVEELSLPEWQRFIKLIRQLLDAPLDVARTPLILREIGFSRLQRGDCSIAYTLCQEAPQAASFAVLIIGYLFRAGNLPREFLSGVEAEVLGYMG